MNAESFSIGPSVECPEIVRLVRAKKSKSSRGGHQTPRALTHLPEFLDSIVAESVQYKVVNLGVIASYLGLYGFR